MTLPELKEALAIFYWRLLRYSPIFRYWYKRTLTEMLFDIEIADIDKEYLMEKYRNKLKKLTS